MDERKEIYLIGFEEESNFTSDVYSMKKMKDLNELNIKLDVVFAEDFKKLLGIKKYCLNYRIETIPVTSDENYFIFVVHYSLNNPDKKNLAALISENKMSKLNLLFRQDPDFNPHII